MIIEINCFFGILLPITILLFIQIIVEKREWKQYNKTGKRRRCYDGKLDKKQTE